MTWVRGILLFIEALCSLLLIVVILMQRTKGEGLGMAFGAEMGESLFGARAGNVLVKITVWLGVIFLVNTTLLAMVYSRGVSSSVMERVGHGRPSAPAASTPFTPLQEVAPPTGVSPPSGVDAPVTPPAVAPVVEFDRSSQDEVRE